MLNGVEDGCFVDSAGLGYTETGNHKKTEVGA